MYVYVNAAPTTVKVGNFLAVNPANGLRESKAFPVNGFLASADRVTSLDALVTAGVLKRQDPASKWPVLSANASGQTLTAAILMGGRVASTTRGAAQTDTTDTAANILASVLYPQIGTKFRVEYNNTAAQAVTIAGGTGVTATAVTAIASGTTILEFEITGAATITVTRVAP